MDSKNAIKNVANVPNKFDKSGGSLTGEIQMNNKAIRLTTNNNGYARLGIDTSTNDVFISNYENNWLRLKSDKTMTYGGHKIYTAFDKPTPNEIGAAESSHTHNYLPLSGGTLSGHVYFNNGKAIYGKTASDLTNSENTNVSSGTNIMLLNYNSSHNFHIGTGIIDNKLVTGNTYLNAANNMYLRNVSSSGSIYLQTGGSTRATINSSGVTASTFTGALAGNASTATKLATARTLTIGNTGKTFNGSSNVSWSLSEIGAIPSSKITISQTAPSNPSIGDLWISW